MNHSGDNRQVVLLKSLHTNNRFYALVAPDRGYYNAQAIDEFPPDLLLGIAYPCLEDGLNDFAVIRTTFETIDVFPDDEELRVELMGIIADARGNLRRRLTELRDRIGSGQAHFLGTDLREFRDYIMHMVNRGTIRKQIDSMMKVDVFESVSQADVANGGRQEPMYRYEFLPQHPLEELIHLSPRIFITRLFDDVLDAVEDDANYQGKYSFDRDVFQKFIAVMFVNYATTDPMFYGTNKADYAVSADRDMNDTPLYQAVANGLREIEASGVDDTVAPRSERPETPPTPTTSPEKPPAAEPAPPGDIDDLFAPVDSIDDLFNTPPVELERQVSLPPFSRTEQVLVPPFALLADVMRLLKGVDHPRVGECEQMVRHSANMLFQSLRDLGVISPVAQNPTDDVD